MNSKYQKMNNIQHLTNNLLKTRHQYLPVFAMIAILLCCACHKPTFSEVPYIEFLSLEKMDNSLDGQVILNFYFEDGDGDIGLEGNISDTLATEDDYNLFINYYEKQNGNFVLLKTDLPLNARIPPLSYSVPESISGTISIKTYINPLSIYDTARFDFYIVDRKKNKSNIATTDEIMIKKKN